MQDLQIVQEKDVTLTVFFVFCCCFFQFDFQLSNQGELESRQ